MPTLTPQPGYIAPELVLADQSQNRSTRRPESEEEDCTYKADVWSLGVSTVEPCSARLLGVRPGGVQLVPFQAWDGGLSRQEARSSVERLTSG